MLKDIELDWEKIQGDCVLRHHSESAKPISETLQGLPCMEGSRYFILVGECRQSERANASPSASPNKKWATA